MTSRYLPKVLFAVFLCASPVDVSAQPPIAETCPHQSVWMPTPEELMKLFKTETTKDRPNFCKADLSDADLRGANMKDTSPDISQQISASRRRISESSFARKTLR
jgi:hypothetical protein